MRIESQRYTERFGSVRINDVQKVLELDSGKKTFPRRKSDIAVHKIDYDTVQTIEERMAVVIPIKNEKLQLFEGVISGVPHDCLIIVVSASKRGRIDRFQMERDTLAQYCQFTNRQAIIVHQKDPHIAKALSAAGYDAILDGRRTIRSGKSEGMVLGILLASLYEKDYVCFIDSDNYVPGSVWEYCKIYAAGFSLATSPYSMVRILWHYKPKTVGEVYFKKWGRVSEVTNGNMNALISSKTGFETDIIKTANAGEHAMSMHLAMMLPYATGFAVEPGELTSIFEGFSGILPSANTDASKQGIEIFQIETKNPHFHEERGVRHLNTMLVPGQSIIYHSPLATQPLQDTIRESLFLQNAIAEDEELVKPTIIPPPQEIDMPRFTASMKRFLPSYSVLEG